MRKKNRRARGVAEIDRLRSENSDLREALRLTTIRIAELETMLGTATQELPFIAEEVQSDDPPYTIPE